MMCRSPSLHAVCRAGQLHGMGVELGMSVMGLDTGSTAPSHPCLYSCAANQGHLCGIVTNPP